MKWVLASLLLLLLAAMIWRSGQIPSQQRFDKQKWAIERQNSPLLNSSPGMLEDLMTRHLSLGMTLEQVTNLLGHPEIRTQIANPQPSVVQVRGEFLEELVYVYHPGTHGNWIVAGTQALVLHFKRDSQELGEWSPLSAAVLPVNPGKDGAPGAVTALPLGNLHVAGTSKQFRELLGPPDLEFTEYQLNYFLGKRAYNAWDQVFLELHFDTSKRLARMVRTEH